MVKGYKYRIYPNKEQEQQINQMLGNARFVYNWALDRRITEYQTLNLMLFTISKLLKINSFFLFFCFKSSNYPNL